MKNTSVESQPAVPSPPDAEAAAVMRMWPKQGVMKPEHAPPELGPESWVQMQMMKGNMQMLGPNADDGCSKPVPHDVSWLFDLQAVCKGCCE